uniref:BHLH domain-containing protein n=1 Tax=Myotis lucifugus TaxID=59463 RepID=G1Q2J5_MYOLU
MDVLDLGLDPAASATALSAVAQGPEAEEGTELQEVGRVRKGPEAEEQRVVAIAMTSVGRPHIQYRFRTENIGGQVARVTDGQLDGQSDTAGAVSVVSAAAFAGGGGVGTQVGVDGAAGWDPGGCGWGSPAAKAVRGEARSAYFPASSVGETMAVLVQTADQSLQARGQFCVGTTPQDVLQTGRQRTIATWTHPYSPKIDGTTTPQMRAQHNEMERKWRDKINNWVIQLSKTIPDCNADDSEAGMSRGGIQSKACDCTRLHQMNQCMQETFQEAERLQMDSELLRPQIEELESENVLLTQLQQHSLRWGARATSS